MVMLHETKCRLECCSETLVETAQWEHNARACFDIVADLQRLQLSSSSSALSKDGGIGGGHATTTVVATDMEVTLADRVLDMEQSLHVLKDLPGAADREHTMERLCGQIEVAVKSRLEVTLREDDDLDDVTLLRWCLTVLIGIHKPRVMREVFCRARPAQVHRVWDTYNMQSGSDEKDDRTNGFVTWLGSFYHDVLQMLQRESRHVRDIFGTDMVMEIVCALVLTTLKPLTTSFRDRLVHSGPSSSNVSLGSLLCCFCLTRGFAVEVVQLFKSLENELGVTLIASDDKTEGAQGILRVVFEPYRVYFTEYARCTSNALTDALLRLVPSVNMTNIKVLDRDEYIHDDRDEAATAPL